jgi:hypothetical protein
MIAAEFTAFLDEWRSLNEQNALPLGGGCVNIPNSLLLNVEKIMKKQVSITNLAQQVCVHQHWETQMKVWNTIILDESDEDDITSEKTLDYLDRKGKVVEILTAMAISNKDLKQEHLKEWMIVKNHYEERKSIIYNRVINEFGGKNSEIIDQKFRFTCSNCKAKKIDRTYEGFILIFISL